MTSDRTYLSLTYPLEIFYYCYRTIEYFLARAHYCCLCDLYQGCQTKRDCLEGARDYCCVCCILNHYSIDELNTVKSDIFKLTEFYLNLLDDVQEIYKVKLDLNFWDDKVKFKFRNWKTGEKSRSYLRDSIEFLYEL